MNDWMEVLPIVDSKHMTQQEFNELNVKIIETDSISDIFDSITGSVIITDIYFDVF